MSTPTRPDVQGWRTTLANVVTNWMSNRPKANVGFRFLWSLILPLDLQMAAIWQAVNNWAPGSPGATPTALPYIAQARGRLQGPTEPDDAFAARCRSFIDDWELCGSSQALALEVQAYLCGQGSLGAGVYPVVRVVERNGDTATANADWSVTFGTVSWTWDSLGGWVDDVGYNLPSVVVGWWSELWVVIQDPYTHYASFSDPAWLAAWNSGEQTFDSLTPQEVVAGVQSIVDTWKGRHMYVRNISWVTDPTTFAPDGYYGNSSFSSGHSSGYARNPAFSYWEPAQGG